MAFEVLITDAVLSDLREIVEYIARDNPDAAERFGHRLVDCALGLATFPNRFGFHDESRHIRKMPLGAYLIYYVINEPEQTVSILHFWHGARLAPDES